MDDSESALLKCVCGSKRLRLTEGKRSCNELFEFYSSRSHIGWRFNHSLADQLAEARRLFPSKGYADVNLVISHKRRGAYQLKSPGRANTKGAAREDSTSACQQALWAKRYSKNGPLTRGSIGSVFRWLEQVLHLYQSTADRQDLG